MKKSLGIYIHIPFCKSRCIYCDFASSVINDANMQKYCEYLQREICLAGNEYAKDYVVDTIYLGGGTPSLLTVQNLKDIMQCLNQNFDIQAKEITIEANPCTIDRQKLEGFVDAGITRVSIGVQSFDDELLKMLGRAHNKQMAMNAIKLAVEYGFDVSVDCMTGLPNQTNEDIENFVDIADGLGVEHISVYMLTVEKGTRLQKLIDNGKLTAKSDDEIASMYDVACAKLKQKSFDRYEISNFCKKGKVSLHNLRYWQRKDYIGLGLSSHSLMNDMRWNNPYSFEKYYAELDNRKLPKQDIQELSQKDIKEEFIMLALRLKSGIDIAKYNNLFGDFKKEFADVLDKNSKYLDIDDKEVAIKDEYLEVMNSIIVDFLD